MSEFYRLEKEEQDSPKCGSLILGARRQFSERLMQRAEVMDRSLAERPGKTPCQASGCLGSEPKEFPRSSSSGRPASLITILKTREPGPGHQTG